MTKYKLKQKNTQTHIPRRLNLLFFVSFLCFVALFLRLGYVQLYQGDTFTKMVQETETTYATGSVPRGMMYDSQGRVLVGNKAQRAILYTRGSDASVSAKDIVEVARQLASLIEFPIQDVTVQDQKDYFIVNNESLVNSRLTKEEKQLRGSDLYQVQLDKVTEEDLDFNESELKIVALFRQMNQAFSLSTVAVKNKNVTEAELARVSEHLDTLPGISLGTDWERIYPEGEMLRSVLGHVSTEQRGLPSERAEELVARGYAMNDRVGISYLEEQYEDALRGSKSVHNIVTNTRDDIVANDLIFEGAVGDNLVLTIDLDFQKKLDEIAENALKTMENQGLNDRIYITAINPKNGDILGVSGKRFEYNEDLDEYNQDEIIDDALGAINTSYGMGSSIKPAMVAMGYQEGVISLDNNIIVDEPLKFEASQEKTSVFNRSGKMPIDDIEALQKSSNIYMIKLAMMIGGQMNYEENTKLNIDPNTINILRDHFAEFGLGTQTGIDLPNESAGFSPESEQSVSAIDLSYGQFDLYTPLQMGQFAATMANGGIRYSPRLVKEIRTSDPNGQLGGVIANIQPEVMNVIDIDPEAMKRIQEGMYQVSHTADGTARYYFMDYPVKVGSKTGTAEAFYAGPIQYAANDPVVNATFVGYAPYDDPEIAISVVVPYLDVTAWGRESTRVAYQVMNAYFESQAETRDAINSFKETFQEP